MSQRKGESREEFLARERVRDRERRVDPEFKTKRKEYNRKYNRKPEVQAKKRAYNSKPEVQAKKRAYNSKPEVRARRRERYNNKPEVQAKRRVREERDRTPRCRTMLDAACREIGGVILVAGDNWTPAAAKKPHFICRACDRARGKAYHATTREKELARRPSRRMATPPWWPWRSPMSRPGGSSPRDHL